MSKFPWNSIAESLVVNDASNPMTYTQALESPCMTCPTTPCCTHLPLNNFKVTNLVELDHAVYLLNFHHIELGISASGDWGAYYTYPCRFLDTEHYKCILHGTDQQPHICQNYNPYNCWYKKVFSVGQNESFIRLDFERMQYLLPHIEIGADRQILSVPAWDQLLQMMQEFEDQTKEFIEPDFSDTALQEWEKTLLEPQKSKEADPKIPLTYDITSNPCERCGAYCCRTLIFPQASPQQLSNLDYYRFALGFPGIEMGISDGIWSMIVKTHCRHLDENEKCRLFGQPERPLICKYYDAWKCDYKPQFEQPRPANFLRVRLEQFDWMCETIPLGENNSVLGLPQTDEMRKYIEQRWRDTQEMHQT